jgi:nicotinate-nucleotide pyrophosphorylase (carboxylating)
MGISVNTRDNNDIENLVTLALAEDLGSQGDITSAAIFDRECAAAVIRSKTAGVCAGAYLLEPIFHHIDTSLDISCCVVDGDAVSPGTDICRLEGPLRAILAGERLALNFLQRLSGIATQTRALVERIEGTGARLLDTRKTTPLLRTLEKRAVRAGGGCNHRFGLYDMILIKDTHVAAAGGVGDAIRKAKAFRETCPDIAIEAEVQSFDELQEAADAAPDRIMLDNMSPELMRRCVEHVRDRAPGVELEASGNVTAESIRAIAETGVDWISAGSITHSVTALDIHLVIVDSSAR